MIDFTPLFRAFLGAVVSGTAIYLLMLGRKGTSAWVWGSACVVSVGLIGLLVEQLVGRSSHAFERWPLLSLAGPMVGALGSVAVVMANRTQALPRWLGIGWSIAGYYGAGMLLRLALTFVP